MPLLFLLGKESGTITDEDRLLWFFAEKLFLRETIWDFFSLRCSFPSNLMSSPFYDKREIFPFIPFWCTLHRAAGL